jgi:hypothetical protein
VPRRDYAPAVKIGKFKPGAGMLIGYETSHKVNSGDGATISVKAHITATTASVGGKGWKGNYRYINHFHVTIETPQIKFGQYNYSVSAGSIKAPSWGDNKQNPTATMMAEFAKIAAAKSKTMGPLV